MPADNNGSGYSRYTRPDSRGNGRNGGRGGGDNGASSLSAYVPPQSIEAEQSTLGAMLLERAAIEKAAEILEKDDFYRDAHQTLFEIITTLAQRDEPVDFITVQNELKNQDKLEAVGGLPYLMALGDVLPSAANVEYYAKIVEEKAILRRLIAAAFEIVGMARGEIEDIGEIIDQAERLVFGVSQQRATQYFAPLRSLLLAVFDKAEELGALKSAISGLPTGIHDFDMITSGLQSTDLIIVAARPSMGKTSFCLSVAEHVALKENKPVAIFSLEMSKEQLALRMLCSQAQVNSHKLRTGHLNEEEWGKLAEVVQGMYDAPIFIDDATETSALTMRAKCRRLMAEHGLGLVVVDYLQLMRSHRRTENRVQEIGEIARGLKSLARELKVPVIALSQLSRAVESRENKRPMLSDLRECVVGSTRLIHAETGRLVSIREVKAGDRVLALGERQKLGAFPVQDVWSTGVKPVFVLTTRTGRAVTATANHPFLTAQGWKRLEELAPGDLLATALRLPQHGAEQPERAEACHGTGCALAEAAAVDETLAVPDWVFESGKSGATAFLIGFFGRFGKDRPVHIVGRRLAEDVQMLSLRLGAVLVLTDRTDAQKDRPDFEASFEFMPAEGDLLWEEIKSVVPAGEEEVFDIAVPGCANFLANGIVAHNSGSIEAEADMVCFLYREAYYKMKEAYSVEGADRPERQEIEETEIIVGKHRNGPTGMVKVGFMAEFAKFVQIEHRDDGPTGF